MHLHFDNWSCPWDLGLPAAALCFGLALALQVFAFGLALAACLCLCPGTILCERLGLQWYVCVCGGIARQQMFWW